MRIPRKFDSTPALRRMMWNHGPVFALICLMLATAPCLHAQDPVIPPTVAPAEKAAAPPPAKTPAVTPSLDEAAAAPEVLYEEGSQPMGEGEPLLTEEPAAPTMTMAWKQTGLPDIFASIREKTGVRIEAKGAVQKEKLDLLVKDKTGQEILDMISTQHDWPYAKEDDGSYTIYTRDDYINTYLARQVIRVPFQLKYIDAEELDKIVKDLLTKDLGSSSPDARTNKLIVTDLPGKIALIEDIINEYDIQLYTRIFEIEHANTDEIAERLDQIRSKSAEIQVDPINHLIIVKDTFEKIKEMEQLVALLDRDLEMRVYHLNNIGPDGEYVDELITTFIQPLATDDPSAILEFQPTTSKLVVKDIRIVQDKILEILQQLDTPKKQVLIEGEVLSVDLSSEFKIGMEWAFSPNILANIDLDQLDDVTDQFDGSIDRNEGLPLTTIGSGGLSVLHLDEYVKAQLNALLSDSTTRLLLQPRLIISNNETGEFNVRRNDPILQTYFRNNNTGSTNYSSSGQSLVSSGLMIEITPSISNRGLVEMEVFFENSQPIFVDDIGNGQRGVGTTEESASTILLVPSGQTRVIGGLISNNQNEGSTGVPILSKIPYLGWLFGSRSKLDKRRNLMFFVTPTIIEEEPLYDLVVEPVNEVARVSMAEEAGEVGIPSEDLVEIPPELEPYLEELRPTVKPMPFGDEEPTTPTLRIIHGTEGLTTPTLPLAHGVEGLTSPTLPLGAGVRDASGLLRSEAYVDTRGLESVTMVGPSGEFGTERRPMTKPTRREPPAEVTPGSAAGEGAPATPAQQPSAKGGVAPVKTPVSTPTPTPAPEAAPESSEPPPARPETVQP